MIIEDTWASQRNDKLLKINDGPKLLFSELGSMSVTVIDGVNRTPQTRMTDVVTMFFIPIFILYFF